MQLEISQTLIKNHILTTNEMNNKIYHAIACICIIAYKTATGVPNSFIVTLNYCYRFFLYTAQNHYLKNF